MCLYIPSPCAAVRAPVQPAVPGLRDEHRDRLSPGEGQQGGTGAGRLVGDQSPRGSQATARRTRNAPRGRRGCEVKSGGMKFNTGELEISSGGMNNQKC